MSFDAAQLSALAAVLRMGSFEAAAHHLSVTPSAISQRIKALETQVGTALIVRGHPARGTAAGARLAAHADHIALMEAQVRQQLQLGAVEPASLRIAVNADSLATWLIPALAAVPDLTFDLVLDDQDHSTDWLRRGEVAAAITAHSVPVQGCRIRPLGALGYVATASPDFMHRHFPDGVTPSALRTAPMMQFDTKDRLQHNWLGRHFPGAAPPERIHHIPSTRAFVDGALAGIGWGLNPEPLVRAHLKTGRLVPLLDGADHATPLYWQYADILSDALRPLSRAIRKVARRKLGPAEDA